MTLIDFTNIAFSLLTIGGQIIAAGLIAVLFLEQKKLLEKIGNRSLLLTFIVALSATLGSLFYSEVIGYKPCQLCWFQRIFMYPQAIILGIALWQKRREILDYCLALSLGGAVISAYHYLLQLGIAPTGNCENVGYSISCSQRFVMQFGYITLPLMALTAFLLIILIIFTAKKSGILKPFIVRKED